MARHRASRETPQVTIVLSDAAYAIALDRAGVSNRALRDALTNARAAAGVGGFSCSARHSAPLMQFYRYGAAYFRVLGHVEEMTVWNVTRAAIADARWQAGLDRPVRNFLLASRAGRNRRPPQGT